MCNLLVVILIILIVFTYVRREYRKSKGIEHFQDFDDFYFTAYKKDFTCSKWLDQLPKHYRLNHTGGVMNVSHNPPTESTCKKIRCPPNMVDDISLKNPEKVDHYNPDHSKIPYSYYGRRMMNCWEC